MIKKSFLALGGLHEDKLQVMAPTNVKTVHQTSLLHIEKRRYYFDRRGLLSSTHDQRSQQQLGQITLQSVLIINKSRFLKVTRHLAEIWKIEIPRSMVAVEALSYLVKPAREPASSRPKPRASLKNAAGILPVHRSFSALVGKKQTVVRDHSAFPQKPPGCSCL